MKKVTTSIAMLLLSASVIADMVQNPVHKITVSTRHKDDKIVINNEFVGKGSVSLNISEVADTYSDNGSSIVRAKGSITIGAMPGLSGYCYNSIYIRAYDRVPRSVFIDTSLCVQAPSLDLNIR